MKKIATTILVVSCIFGLSSCGDSNKTTIIKKESKIDSDGNERTKIETKTEETTVRNGDGTVIHEHPIEVKKDPIVKLGPLEIK